MNLNKKIIAWALYDLANTAFTSPFVTIFWPLLVTEIIGGDELHLGITIALGVVAFSLVIPFIGLFSDRTNMRKPFVVIPTIAMIIMIAFLPKFNLMLGLILAGIVTVLYNISLSIYNTLLPHLASEKDMGKVSGFGMACGFIGTIASMFIAELTLKYFENGQPLVMRNGETDSLITLLGVKATFPVIAVFFLVFSLPFIFIYKDEGKKKLNLNFSQMLRKIFTTLKELFHIKGMIPYFAYFALFSNALAAIDIFFYLFSKNEVHMHLIDFIHLFMGQSIGAALGALILGKLADKYGAKMMLKLSTIMWVFVVGIFIFSRNIKTFWIAGLIGSFAFGGSMANARTLFVFLTPSDKTGEFFGYSQIVSRLAAMLGPVIGGWLIVKYGYNSVLYMIMTFILFSLIYLYKTPDLRSITKA